MSLQQDVSRAQEKLRQIHEQVQLNERELRSEQSTLTSTSSELTTVGVRIRQLQIQAEPEQQTDVLALVNFKLLNLISLNCYTIISASSFTSARRFNGKRTTNYQDRFRKTDERRDDSNSEKTNFGIECFKARIE